MAKRRQEWFAQRTTLLAMGEGSVDVAFLKHLRQLYCAQKQGVNVTIRNAHGKGPGNVIRKAIGFSRTTSFDRKLCLIDTDLPWTRKQAKEASDCGIRLIGSTPCIEGLLLRILGVQVPQLSVDCKRALQQLAGTNFQQPEDYQTFFPLHALENARSTIEALDTLICMFKCD